MIKRLGIFILLAGCTAGVTTQTEIGPLRVFYDENNTFFTGPELVNGNWVEPFPAPGSLVVTYPNGTDLEYSILNRDQSEIAMHAYCETMTGSDRLRNFTFQNGRFAGYCFELPLAGRPS
ncbi:MAG: hypothetical protein ACSHWY_05530 [Octadecabacter sp.]